MKTFEEACKKNDIVEVLKLIRGLCCKHDQNNKNKFYAVFNRLRALLIKFQKSDQTNKEYLKEFQVCILIFDDYNANIVSLVPCLVEESVKEMFQTLMERASDEEIKRAREYVLKKRSATLLLIGVDRTRYRSMKNQMQQNMAVVTNNKDKQKHFWKKTKL